MPLLTERGTDYSWKDPLIKSYFKTTTTTKAGLYCRSKWLIADCSVYAKTKNILFYSAKCLLTCSWLALSLSTNKNGIHHVNVHYQNFKTPQKRLAVTGLTLKPILTVHQLGWAYLSRILILWKMAINQFCNLSKMTGSCGETLLPCKALSHLC